MNTNWGQVEVITKADLRKPIDHSVYEAKDGTTVHIQYPPHRGGGFTSRVVDNDLDIYGHLPVLCGDCNAPLQEAQSAKKQEGQQVFRCPWTTSAHIEAEYEDDELLILFCDHPKGKVGVRGQPGVAR